VPHVVGAYDYPPFGSMPIDPPARVSYPREFAIRTTANNKLS
jgi:hypothetical protein